MPHRQIVLLAAIVLAFAAFVVSAAADPNWSTRDVVGIVVFALFFVGLVFVMLIRRGSEPVEGHRGFREATGLCSPAIPAYGRRAVPVHAKATSMNRSPVFRSNSPVNTDAHVATNSGNTDSSPAEDVLVNYFRAKDGNRPHLLERVFCAEAQLAVKNATAAIQFPALTRGRETIADVLVRNFGRDNDNVYSFYLSTPPTEEVERFTCRWLVGMTEKSSKSVRVGCGTYDWTLNFDPVPCATALVISIELMQVLPPQDAGRVIAWLERLPYPWASAQSVVSTAPAIELLQPVIDFLRHG
jgi:hypothetical protein